MSRIHEALKKAEIERAADESVEVRPLLVAPQMATAPEGLKVESIEISPPRSSATNGTTEPSRLDDLRARCVRVLLRFDPDASVFLEPGRDARCAERFRTLRSKLYQLRSNEPLRTIVVTSPEKGEGKSFVLSNLAQAFVRQPDRSVLIIDADLRRPSMHTLLGSAASPGLTDYLLGKAAESSVMQFAQIGAKSALCFIPSGKTVPNPSELLSNGRFKALLTHVAPAFDWILIDSPPCLPVSDASMLAEFADGVLVVVKAGSTPKALAERAQQELHNRHVIGVVLNSVEEWMVPYGAYYKSGDDIR
jgi:protein-tyrosine kinase